jgi:hypothetical protein
MPTKRPPICIAWPVVFLCGYEAGRRFFAFRSYVAGRRLGAGGLQPCRQLGKVSETVLHDAVVNELIAVLMRTTAEVIIFSLMRQIHNPLTRQLVVGRSLSERLVNHAVFQRDQLSHCKRRSVSAHHLGHDLTEPVVAETQRDVAWPETRRKNMLMLKLFERWLSEF